MIRISVLHNELEKFVEEKSGFSVFIEVFGKKILFDTSINKDILKNARKLNIDLSSADYIVLSHGHWDHTEGLQYLTDIEAEVIAHPACFDKKYYEDVSIGAPFTMEEMEEHFHVKLSKEPYFLTEKIVFLGEIPRRTPFESQDPLGYLTNGDNDFLLDDSALAIKSQKGLIVISGCSHAGICNIIIHAKKVCNEDRIHAVLGGFHLFDKEKTNKTVKFLTEQDIGHIYPAHCLDTYAFSAFEKIGADRIHTCQQLVL
ncbi:MAG: MBL fold metallo-hydrolase [Euryarchaeota archaeon]|nr:MBL fold metallo-hydrolase [Euryarchaeota archaeon]